MNKTLLAAFGLMLIFEGILPLVAPKAWREAFKKMVTFKDGQLRFIGLISMIGGLVLLLISQ